LCLIDQFPEAVFGPRPIVETVVSDIFAPLLDEQLAQYLAATGRRGVREKEGRIEQMRSLVQPIPATG
jgi:hypothetical protein